MDYVLLGKILWVLFVIIGSLLFLSFVPILQEKYDEYYETSPAHKHAAMVKAKIDQYAQMEASARMVPTNLNHIVTFTQTWTINNFLHIDFKENSSDSFKSNEFHSPQNEEMRFVLYIVPESDDGFVSLYLQFRSDTIQKVTVHFVLFLLDSHKEKFVSEEFEREFEPNTIIGSDYYVKRCQVVHKLDHGALNIVCEITYDPSDLEMIPPPMVQQSPDANLTDSSTNDDDDKLYSDTETDKSDESTSIGEDNAGKNDDKWALITRPKVRSEQIA